MIFFWNVRGLNGRNKLKEVARWLNANNPLIGGLLETRVREHNLLEVLRSTVPGWRFEANYSENAVNGRIVVVWNPLLSVVTFFKSDQLMLCGIFYPATNKSFSVAFAYGRHTKVDRRPLWESLSQLASSRNMANSPWLIMGDFNQILYAEEHYSLSSFPLSIQGINEFQQCLDTSQLQELSYRGCYHTWTNRQPHNPIARKLDRVLCNENWTDSFPHSVANFDAPGPSDHSPCLMTLDQNHIGRKVPFKFFSFFTTHPDYHKII